MNLNQPNRPRTQTFLNTPGSTLGLLNNNHPSVLQQLSRFNNNPPLQGLEAPQHTTTPGLSYTTLRNPSREVQMLRFNVWHLMLPLPLVFHNLPLDAIPNFSLSCKISFASAIAGRWKAFPAIQHVELILPRSR